MTRVEQETILRWDEDEHLVIIYAASPVTWRKYARLGLPVVKEHRAPDGNVSGRWYRVPLSQFRWGLKSITRSALTPEARARGAAALAAARRKRRASALPVGQPA